MPNFSWEINQARLLSTLVAVCEPPIGVSLDWSLSFKYLEMPPMWDFMRLSGLPWGEARTQAAMQCLSGGYSWLFFIDADIILPKDALMKMLSRNLPIISGLYYQRFPTWNGITAEYLPCMFNEVIDANKVPTKQPITEWAPGSLLEVAYVPAGMLLVHRSVFERFIQAGVKRVFEWTLHADNPSAGRSEDFEFAARARQLGFKCVVDTSVIGTHETPGRITPKGFLPKI